jgi:hypothetical protein
MSKHILFALFALISLHAEEPVLPPEAKALLPETPLVPTKPKPEEGTITQTEKGWLLDSPGKLKQNYNLAVSRRFEAELPQGAVCLAVIKARTVSTDKPDGKGRISFGVQNTKDYRKSPAWKGRVIGKEWDTTEWH